MVERVRWMAYHLVRWIRWELRIGWTCTMRVYINKGGVRWSESVWYCKATGEKRRVQG